MLSSFKKCGSAKAKPIEHGVVAIFRESLPPSVWYLDTDKSHEFKLFMQAEEDGWALVMEVRKEGVSRVARFVEREDAERAMNVVQKALLKKGRCRWKFPTSLVITFIVAFTVLYLAHGVGQVFYGVGQGISKMKSMMPQMPQMPDMSKLQNMQNLYGMSLPGGMQLPQMPGMPAVPSAPVTVQDGVPMTADDVLKAPAGD